MGIESIISLVENGNHTGAEVPQKLMEKELQRVASYAPASQKAEMGNYESDCGYCDSDGGGYCIKSDCD